MAARVSKPLTPLQTARLLGEAGLVRLANRVARREMKHRVTRYGDNVLAITVADRRKGARQSRRRAELAIRFVVERKFNPEELDALLPTHKGQKYIAIPPHLSIRHTHQGKQHVTTFPTDVVQQPPAVLMAAAAAQPTQTHVVVSGGPDPAEIGAICCVVRNCNDTAVQFLSCNHVFAAMKSTPDFKGLPFLKIDQKLADLSSVALISNATRIARISPADSSAAATPDKAGLDAAIAQVDPKHINVVSSTINGRRPVDVHWSVFQLKKDQSLRVVTPFGTKTAVIDTVYLAGHVFPVATEAGVKYLYFNRLLEYTIASPHLPLPGDSGGAVIDPKTQKLVGMHFAGIPETGRGFAMLAADIFADGVFDCPISLTPFHR